MSEADSTKAVAVAFGGVTPIFRVQSLPASLDYYLNVLGFNLDWEGPGIFASVSRDDRGSRWQRPAVWRGPDGRSTDR
jgi:hypothetical protein